MAISVTFNGTTYSIPEAREVGWSSLTNFLVDVGTNAQTISGQNAAIRIATSSPVTVANTDYGIVTKLTVAGAVTVNLPTGTAGKEFAIIDGTGDAATNAVTINAFAGQTINGAASYTFANNQEAIILQYSTTTLNWYVESSFKPNSLSRLSTDQGVNRVKNKDLEDSTVAFVDNSDATKKVKLEVSGVTTATTRTMTVPDADLTIVGTATTQTLTNKTLTSPVITDYNQYTEVATPSTPASGFGRTYVGTDSKFHFINDDGLNKTIGDSGTGEVNAVLNPSDASAGWSAGTAHAVSTLSTGSPLSPINTSAIQIQCTSNQVESSTSGGIYTVTTMPTGLRNKKLKVEFYFTTPASDTWALSVYASGTRQPLSTDSSSVTALPVSTTGKYTAYFDAAAGTSYTIAWTRTAGSGTTNLIVTNLVNGPGIQPQGAVVSPSQTIAMVANATAFGTVTLNSFKYERVGTWMHLHGYFKAGTVTANDMKIAFPAGFTIDYSSGLTTTNAMELGTWFGASSTSAFGTGNVFGVVFADGSDTGNIYLSNQGASSAFDKSDANNLASSSGIGIDCWVPISEFSGGGTVNLAQNDVEYASVAGTWDAASTTTVYGPGGSIMGGTLTATRNKTITWQTPVQSTDRIQIYASNDQINWMPILGASLGAGDIVVVPSLNSGGSLQSGVDWVQGATSVQTIIRFRQFASMANDDSPTNNWPSDAYWRVTKAKSGQAVGFGTVSQYSNGLMPYQHTNLDDASATRLGLKHYSHGTSYNGGNAPTLSLLSGGGTFTSVTHSYFYPRQRQDGVWLLSGQFRLLLSSTSRTNPRISIAGGFTFNAAGSQIFFATTDSVAPIASQGSADSGTSDFSISHPAATATSYLATFSDLVLSAKPNWAY